MSSLSIIIKKETKELLTPGSIASVMVMVVLFAALFPDLFLLRVHRPPESSQYSCLVLYTNFVKTASGYAELEEELNDL